MRALLLAGLLIALGLLLQAVSGLSSPEPPPVHPVKVTPTSAVPTTPAALWRG